MLWMLKISVLVELGVFDPLPTCSTLVPPLVQGEYASYPPCPRCGQPLRVHWVRIRAGGASCGHLLVQPCPEAGWGAATSRPEQRGAIGVV
jgi:hypothetical protein